MPLDAAGFRNDLFLPAADQAAVFMERRRTSIAFLSDLPSSRLMIYAWSLDRFGPEPRGCFVGWLAMREFDGWHMDFNGEPRWSGGLDPGAGPVLHAEEYFGLGFRSVLRCFAARCLLRQLSGRSVRMEDVAARLLAAPVRV